MLLLPVSHEDGVTRRFPWISVGIFAICVAMQIHSCAVTPGLEQRAGAIEAEMLQLEQQVIEEYEASESLEEKRESDDALIEKLAGGGSELAMNRTFRDSQLDAHTKFKKGELTEPGDPRFERYAELEAELKALANEVPAVRFGYRPALDGMWRMLTAMSSHAGWLHLLGNMWFLYLVGCNLEDRWGRWQFATFYVVAGCIAALAFRALHRGSIGPLIGASGAVAGAMGAFLVCFARTKVRMFYVYWLMATPRWGTFQASAKVVLTVWVGEQFVMTFLEARAGDSPVAYSAHAGGFLFGAVVAFLLRKSGVDSQLDQASEQAADAGATVFQEHPLYLQAVEQRGQARDADAIETLAQLLAEAPGHVAAHELLAELGLVHRDLRALDFGLPFVIDQCHRLRMHEALVELYKRLRQAVPQYGLTDQELLRVATAAGHTKDDATVIQVVSMLIEQHPQSSVLPRALWLASETQARMGASDLQRDTLLRLVRRFPEHAFATRAREQLVQMEA